MVKVRRTNFTPRAPTTSSGVLWKSNLLDSYATAYCRAPEKEHSNKVARLLGQELGARISDPKELLKVLQRPQNRHAIPGGTGTSLPAIRTSLALCEFLKSSRLRFRQYVPVLMHSLAMPMTAKFNLEILVVRSVIQYIKNDRRIWSHDAQAIRWLQREGVTSEGFDQWQAVDKGSVFTWARAEQIRARQSAKRRASAAARPVTALQRLKNVRQELSVDQGAMLFVKKVGGSLICVGCTVLTEPISPIPRRI